MFPYIDWEWEWEQEPNKFEGSDFVNKQQLPEIQQDINKYKKPCCSITTQLSCK